MKGSAVSYQENQQHCALPSALRAGNAWAASPECYGCLHLHASLPKSCPRLCASLSVLRWCESRSSTQSSCPRKRRDDRVSFFRMIMEGNHLCPWPHLACSHTLHSIPWRFLSRLLCMAQVLVSLCQRHTLSLEHKHRGSPPDDKRPDFALSVE